MFKGENRVPGMAAQGGGGGGPAGNKCCGGGIGFGAAGKRSRPDASPLDYRGDVSTGYGGRERNQVPV